MAAVYRLRHVNLGIGDTTVVLHDVLTVHLLPVLRNQCCANVQILLHGRVLRCGSHPIPVGPFTVTHLTVGFVARS